MHIKSVSITNFRLLKDVKLSLNSSTTVIVGRNNSGKTSLTEFFRRISGGKPTFQLEDFALDSHDGFWKAYLLKRQGAKEPEIREALPIVEARITVDYQDAPAGLGPVSEFIIDLDDTCTEAIAVVRYQLAAGRIDELFGELTIDEKLPEPEQKQGLYSALKTRVHRLYAATLEAVDPGDPTNRKALDFPKLQSLLHVGFINAQRGMDDTTKRTNEVLSKVLQAACAASADDGDREIVAELQNAVKSVQEDVADSFNANLERLLPTLQLFGYPGLVDPGLRTETTLDVESLLANNTKVQYEGANGVNLPESYNGLGTRNLIYILLKVYEFFKETKALPSNAGTNVLFIEEPEAHLHPQMQEVFIRQLQQTAEFFSKQYNGGVPWRVQFIVTTHSSHISNEASFNSIRYFLTKREPTPGTFGETRIKDLQEGLVGEDPGNLKFLHEYITLTRCDLFFADKAVLIEGPTERLLLPVMIQSIDKDQPADQCLSNQYVSVVEVGGAFAHMFFRLLDFLEVRTLIITDLDSGKKNENGKIIKCKVIEGTHTTNPCIKKWFDAQGISPAELIKKDVKDKLRPRLRLSYEIPEADGGPCGRSFEQAFVLANPEYFKLQGKDANSLEAESWERAEDVDNKIDFALEFLDRKSKWNVPRYIAEGLRWLAAGDTPPALPVATERKKTVAAKKQTAGSI